MKVRELIESLATLNPEADVFISVDAEGNQYKVIAEAVAMADLRLEVNPDKSWLVNEYWQEGMVSPDEMAVVVWPVN